MKGILDFTVNLFTAVFAFAPPNGDDRISLASTLVSLP